MALKSALEMSSASWWEVLHSAELLPSGSSLPGLASLFV